MPTTTVKRNSMTPTKYTARGGLKALLWVHCLRKSHNTLERSSSIIPDNPDEETEAESGQNSKEIPVGSDRTRIPTQAVLHQSPLRYLLVSRGKFEFLGETMKGADATSKRMTQPTDVT